MIVNTNLRIPMSLQPHVVNLWYFKIWVMLGQVVEVWNIKGLPHQVAKIWGSENRFVVITQLLQINVLKKLTIHPNRDCSCFRFIDLIILGDTTYLLIVHLTTQPGAKNWQKVKFFLFMVYFHLNFGFLIFIYIYQK